jgi:type VI secretion system secreted protein Hcp
MALNAYLKLKGQKQGDINGSVTQKGREKMIMVIAVSHEIVSPRDAASGQATGKRVHKPFVITKEIDKSTPLLAKALVTNEVLSSFALDFWRPSVGGSTGAGAETNFYKVQLTNARIASIAMHMDNNTHPDLQKYAPYEEIAFTYEKITWTFVDGGITAMDDWEA